MLIMPLDDNGFVNNEVTIDDINNSKDKIYLSRTLNKEEETFIDSLIFKCENGIDKTDNDDKYDDKYDDYCDTYVNLPTNIVTNINEKLIFEPTISYHKNSQIKYTDIYNTNVNRTNLPIRKYEFRSIKKSRYKESNKGINTKVDIRCIKDKNKNINEKRS